MFRFFIIKIADYDKKNKQSSLKYYKCRVSILKQADKSYDKRDIMGEIYVAKRFIAHSFPEYTQQEIYQSHATGVDH